MASNNQIGIILTVDGRAVPAELERAGQAFGKFSSGAQQSLDKVAAAQERQEGSLQQLSRQTEGLTRAMQGNVAANSAGAQAAQNAAQALHQQSEAGGAAAAAAQSHARSVAAAAQSSGQMGSQAATASTAVGGLTSSILATVTATLSLSKAIQEMDAWTNMNNRIRLVTETQGQFAQAQSNILQIANDTRQPLKETADLYQRLATNQKTLGLSGSELAGIVKTISQSMVISGVSTASGSAALMQLGQAFNSGVLRGEEFNSVMEQAPGLMQAIAAGMGRTVGEMRALAEAGKITTEALVKALQSQAAAVEANYGKMGATVGQSLTVAGNRLTEFVGRMDEVSGVSRVLSGAIIGLSDNMGPLLTMTGALAAAGLATWMTSATAAAGGLSVAIGGIGLALRGVLTAMGPAGWLILGLGAAATAWQLLGDKSATAGHQMESAADKASSVANKLVAGIVPALNTAIAAYDKMLEKQRQSLGTAKTPIEEVSKGIKEADLNLQKLAQQVAQAQRGTGEYLNFSLQQRAAAEKSLTAELERAALKRAELTARESEYNAGVVTQYVKGKERQTEAGLKLLKTEEAKANRDKALAAAGDDRAKQDAINAAYRVELANIEEKSSKKKTDASVKLVDTELAGLKAKLDAERQYGEQLSTTGLKAQEWTEGQKQAVKLSYEIAQGDAAAARSHDARAKAKWALTRAELEGRQVAAEALGQQQSSNQAREEALKTLSRQTSKSTEAAAALESENAAWGKSKTAIESAALAVLHLKKADLTGKETQAYREELDRAIAAQQRWVDALGQADYKKQSQAIEEWNRAATEQATLYQDELRLVGMTALEQEKITAQRSVQLKLAKTIADIERQTFSDNIYQDYGKKQDLIQKARDAAQIESSAAVNKVVQNDWLKTSEKIGDSITDALMRGFESGKGFARSLRDSVVNMFKTLVLQPIVKDIVMPVAGTITGVMGIGGSTAAAAGQGGGSALGQASSVYDAYRFLSGGIRNSIGNSFTKLASTEYGQKLGLYDADAGTRGLTQSGQFASSTLQSAGSAMTAYSISKMLSGEYKIGNGKIMDALTAVAGWFDPTGGLLSGAVSAGLNRAFGMGAKKIDGSGVTGTFSASGASVQEYADWTQKGGWFRSSKSGRNYSAVSSELDTALDSGLQAITSATQVYAKAIGLSASAVNGFSQSISISLKDLDQAGQQKAIADALSSFGTGMTEAAYGAALRPFQRAGETIDGTLSRLSGSLVAANSALRLLGQQLYGTSTRAGDMASSLLDLFGGTDKFNAATTGYYQNFYTESERTAAATAQVSDALKSLGFSMPETRDGFRALVDAQELTTASGRQAYAALIGLESAFAALVPSTDDLSALARQAGEAISGLFNSLKESITQGRASVVAAHANLTANQTPLSYANLTSQVGKISTAPPSRAKLDVAIANGNDESVVAYWQGLLAKSKAALKDAKSNYWSGSDPVYIAQQDVNRDEYWLKEAKKGVSDIKTETAKYATAVTDWVNSAATSVSTLDSLRQSTVDYYEQQKALSSLMLTSAANMRSAIQQARLNTMTGSESIAQRLAGYDKLYTLALSASGATKVSYADQMTSALPQLAQDMAGQYSTRADWAVAVAKLSAKGEKVAGQLDATAPKDYQAEANTLLTAIDGKLAALDASAASTQAGISAAVTAGANRTSAGLQQIINQLQGKATSAFSDGGYTGPGGKYEAAGIVHAGEVVFSQADIAALGGVRAVEAIRTGRAPGYADGGVVGLASVPVPVFAGRVPAASGSPGEQTGVLAELQLVREALDSVVREIKAMRRDNNQGHKRTEEQVGGVARVQRSWTANGLPAQEGAAFA